MGSLSTDQEMRKLERRYERLVEEEEALGRLLSELSDVAWIWHTPVSERAVGVLAQWAQGLAEALDRQSARPLTHLRLRLEQARPRIYRGGALDRKLWCRLVADCEETIAGMDLTALQWRFEALRAERRRLRKQLMNLRRHRFA